MKKRVVVGGTLEAAGRRVVEAVRRAALGRRVRPSDTTTFVTWSALAKVMTDKRHALLIHLRSTPAVSIRALARDVARDYKRVHDDVTALERIGLIERRNGRLVVGFDEIVTVVPMKKAAA